MDNTTILASLGIVSTCVWGLIWIIKHLFNRIMPALEGLKAATTANTKATESADTYLRERNGRDNKMHIELIKAVREISDQVVESTEALKDASINQHIDKQAVTTQVVLDKSTAKTRK